MAKQRVFVKSEDILKAAKELQASTVMAGGYSFEAESLDPDPQLQELRTINEKLLRRIADTEENATRSQAEAQAYFEVIEKCLDKIKND
jgi:histone H3/H4